MTFSIANVIFLLRKKFPDPLPSAPSITREEEKMATHCWNIINQAVDGDIEVYEDDDAVDDNHEDWIPEEFEPSDDVVLASHRDVMFGDRSITRELLDEAIVFFRGTKKGSRTLSSMMEKYKWIKRECDLSKLRKYEKERDDFTESRTNLLRRLGKTLYEVVKDKLEKGMMIHDSDLASIAREINNNETKVENFIASSNWVSKWKKSHRIVSRRITKFVTRRCMRDKVAIRKTADDFVRDTKREMSPFDPYMIFNADQTGIQKELYGARSLAFLGDKVVERLVQAKSSLTHSFTFLPMIFMNGSLGPKAFIEMSEPATGCFPPSRPIPKCPNLEVRAAKSHIMGKELMCDWIKTCVAHASLPKRLLMIVDSWPSFKDHATIQQCFPPGYDVTIKNIPPHTTSMIQPLDSHWNGPWKNLIKKFTTHVLNFHPDFLIANRNNEIWMISLLYHQVSAREFQSFMMYSWKRCGYLDSTDTFLTPSQHCFGQVEGQLCYFAGCYNLAFIFCARCKEYICFSHFIVDEKHLCPNV